MFQRKIAEIFKNQGFKWPFAFILLLFGKKAFNIKLTK